MEIKNVKSISDHLHKYDYTINKDDPDNFIEITQWQNMEGYTITVRNHTVNLTDGEVEAIYHLIHCLQYDTEK